MTTVKSDAQQLRTWITQHPTDAPSGWEGLFRQQPTYTAEQVKRHNTEQDGWVLDHQTRKIYCITPMLSADIISHPHVESAQMRQQFQRRLGGGVDVHRDVENHRGARQQQLWAAMCIGKLAAGESFPEPFPERAGDATGVHGAHPPTPASDNTKPAPSAHRIHP